MANYRVFCDLETTGLQSDYDVVLEIGFVVTDIYGKVIAMYGQPVSGSAKVSAIERAKKDPVVGPMHENSKLWDDLETFSVATDEEVEWEILDWLAEFDIQEKPPLAGSAVHFDRAFINRYFPKLHGFFSYHNIDVSSIKELCRDLAPDVYARLATGTNPQKLHRVIPDILDTIEEYQFYLNNFLKIDTQ